MTPKLRVARPTADLDALLPFYMTGLGLKVLARFEGHDGFDGVMLGHPQAPWHLEFTCSPHPAPRAPSLDNLLVLYLPNRAEWQAAVARMRAAGFAPVSALNPYWDRQGATFEDPEGWRVVLQYDGWEL